MIDPNCPAAKMVGVVLVSGWEIKERLPAAPNPTGGNFGVPYRAERAGEIAFVKAIDFSSAGKQTNPAARLRLLRDFLNVADFEREALEFCRGRGMSRIVRLLNFDLHPGGTGNGWDDVYCLVCELGEGDLRKKLSAAAALAASNKVRLVSDVARAMGQLHRDGMAHQDLKPSNVITIVDGSAKVGDLGRVVRKGVPGPFDTLPFAGAKNYRPPEYLYGHTPADWVDHRDAADCFCVGGIMFFTFTGASLAASLLAEIPPPLRPSPAMRYDDTVRAVWTRAQATVISNQLAPCLPESYKEELIEIFRSLTHPDPTLRGHPRSRRQHGRPIGLDRYADRLAQLSMHLSHLEQKAPP